MRGFHVLTSNVYGLIIYYPLYNSIDFELESGLEINIPSHAIHVLNYAWPLTSTKNGSRTAVTKTEEFVFLVRSGEYTIYQG